ncbi:MAG TPA: universal stress protein [Baekduia sp.]|nr:universal stress protein [Baekduia sp.]
MTQPVVVAVAAGEAGHEAVALGVAMARLLEAPIVLGGVGGTRAGVGRAVAPGWVPPYPDAAAQEADVRDVVSGFCGLVPDDVPCAAATTTAPTVVEGLDRLAEQHEAALLVLGAGHLGTAVRSVRGDIALGALRHASCPVLVVPDADRRRTPGPGLRTIGVAWDRSPEAEAALATAVDLAERAGADVRILHVVEPAPPLAAPALHPASFADYYAEARAQAARDLEHVTSLARRRVPAAALIGQGPLTAELEALTLDVDLLVVGSRRRGPLRRVALGSTSAAAVHHAHCPLLVVPRGTRAPVAA